MCPPSAINISPVFRGPTTPAAVCFQVIRLKQPVTRTHLFQHSTHSQPTIARAVTALIDAHLVRERPLANIGISASGVVREQKFITAPNLGWDGEDIVTPFARLFDVPITVASVVEAIAGAEQQTQEPPLRPTGSEPLADHRGLIFYVDDTTGAAIHTRTSVESIDLNIGKYPTLAAAALDLTARTEADTVVLAGSAFAKRADTQVVGRALQEIGGVEVRVIPTHIDNARAAARALALSGLLTNPLTFSKQLSLLIDEYAI